MHTLEPADSAGRRRRRRHSEAFKTEAIAACRAPGVSIASIAMSRGVNANLLRRWVTEAERTEVAPAELRTEKLTSPPAIEHTKGFVPVAMPSKVDDSSIRLEVRRGSTTVVVQWPASAAQVCAMLLRELLR